MSKKSYRFRGVPRARLACLVASALGIGCSLTTEVGELPIDPACQLHGQGEKTPGYPYNMDTFRTAVWPVLSDSCGGGSCHGAPASRGGFSVSPAIAGDSCNTARTFNSAVAKIDLVTPANSPLLAAVNGSPGHPFVFPASAPGLTVLTDFVHAAAEAYAADGGTIAPPGPSPFDYAIFQSQIQPAFDAAGCVAGSCHAAGAGGFTMYPAPAAGSAEMEAAFIAVTSRASLEAPARSLIYTRATVVHGGGASSQLAPASAEQLLAWITTAKANAGAARNPTCAPVAAFNLGVFHDELLPILSGAVDLNRPDHLGHGAGCMASVCHGVDRGPGKLSLLPSASDAALLQNVACFVNLAVPSASEVLVCPSDYPGCRTEQHPGQDVFGGALDLNYRRLLAFIYASKRDVSPFDYAFFVRKVNPMFGIVDRSQGGDPIRACTDIGCHGVQAPGEPASNGSDLALLSEAFGEARLGLNFVSATGFVNFIDPRESSLFLYPTNEIANRAAHPLATGNRHPGGYSFAADSAAAQAIVTWAAGLRPDENGYQRNWLVMGDFLASQIFDPAPIDEAGVTPRIFDPGGGAFNIGQWDGLFASDATVDLDAVFSRPATSGRIAYATSYVVNTYDRPQTVQIIVTTSNPLRLFINGELRAQNLEAGGTSALVMLTGSGAGRSARILIKLMQRPGDPQFAFSVQLEDERGTVLTDHNSGLVFTLSPNGGI